MIEVADGNVGALQVGICVAATVKLFVLKVCRAIVKTGHIYRSIALMEDKPCGRKRFDAWASRGSP